MNKADKKKDKQDRLAQALRDNLRRRKQHPLTSSQNKTPASDPTDKAKE